jgi:DNA-binding NarL/FixJ family response regulator
MTEPVEVLRTTRPQVRAIPLSLQPHPFVDGLGSSRVQQLAQSISRLTCHPDVQKHFESALAALGAEAGVFCSFAHGQSSLDRYRYLLSIAPEFIATYRQKFWYANDPSLLYAQTHTEPVLIKRLPLTTASQAHIVAEAAKHGLASGVVVPVHAPAGANLSSVLVFGSSHPGHFDTASLDALRQPARILAMELQDYFFRCVRAQLLETSKLTAADIELYRYEALGYRSKHIACELGTTAQAVDARFGRINSKLGVRSRREGSELLSQHALL